MRAVLRHRMDPRLSERNAVVRLFRLPDYSGLQRAAIISILLTSGRHGSRFHVALSGAPAGRYG